MTSETESLRALLAPRSIAVLGASRDLNKLSGRPIKFLQRAGYAGTIYPVNPKYDEIAGLACYPAVEAIPGPVDLGVVAVPARATVAAIEALGAKGAGAAVVFSSGFGEMGAEGKALENDLRAAAARHGIRLLGPNTLGLINAFEGVFATFSQYANRETPSGPIGFVTQSGAFGTAIASLARLRGLGLGYFVNTGNESDVDFVSAMGPVLEDPRIRVGAGYIEGLKDGAGLARLARRAMDLDKPLVVTKVGRTGAGARASASHTGSLAGEDAVFDGVVRQYAITRARNEAALLDLAELFATTAVPDGRGVGIITQSGGAGVLMADRAEELGLSVPTLAEPTRQALGKVLPAFGALGNPVDVTAQFIADPTLLRDSIVAVLDDPQVHVAAVWLQLMHEFVEPLVDTFRQTLERVRKPFVVCWIAAPEEGLQALRDMGLCVFTGGEPAIDAIAGLIRYGESRRAWAAEGPPPALPAGATLPAGAGVVPSLDAAAVLADAGVPLAEARLAADAEAAVAAAEDLGYPVVMKIESPDLPHKTEADGVRLGLADADAVRAAYASVMAAALAHRPDARLSGVLVQATAAGPVEMVVGLRRDPVFGMVVMAGLGGIFIEVQKDVAFRQAPVSERQALAMLDELRGQAVLDGVRGRPGADRAGLAALIAAVSRFGAANAGRLAELDLNPVLAGPGGAVAVDWLMVLDGD
ncbi:MAG: acetate--CoA ligase family protein [Hyphomicrobiales bacterium]|nr:acetate--CoA ligase family protein [Hyphomicrobiales bacterium]